MKTFKLSCFNNQNIVQVHVFYESKLRDMRTMNILTLHQNFVCKNKNKNKIAIPSTLYFYRLRSIHWTHEDEVDKLETFKKPKFYFSVHLWAKLEFHGN